MQTSRRFQITIDTFTLDELGTDANDNSYHSDLGTPSDTQDVTIAQALLDLIPDDEKPLIWIDPTRIICGYGEAARITTVGNDAGHQASQQWMDIARNADIDTLTDTFPQCTLPIAVGSFGFASDTPGTLIAPKHLYIWEAGRGIFKITQDLTAENNPNVQTSQGEALFTIGNSSQDPPSTIPDKSLPEDQWKAAVQTVIDHMNAGEATKVVMARREAVHTENPVDARKLAGQLTRAYPSCWTYCVDGFIGATPEMLADVHAGQLRCLVLAGTAGRDEGEALFASAKNRREHELAVQSVEEVLRPMCAQVQIPLEPKILQLPNVTHLATDISGLAGEASALDIASALHPTAAVCGTPRDKAAELMKRYENMSRERYAGPIGWIDARGDGQWGIALRGGQINTEDCRRVDIYAGGGIMPDSDPEVEFAETVAKMRPMREAIAAVDKYL